MRYFAESFVLVCVVGLPLFDALTSPRRRQDRADLRRVRRSSPRG